MITNLKSNKINDQIYLLLYFLSAPIFLWLVYSSKTYLFPCLLIALIFRYLFTIKRINNIILITLAIYLAYILACKVSFLYEIIIIFCLFIYKKISQIKLNQFIYIFFFSGLIILFPIYYTKFIFFSDIIPPFFENLKTNPDLKMLIFKETLIKDLQDFSKFHYAKIFFLPIILIVTLKVNFFSALLGVGFLGFYLCFVKKKILFRFIKKPEFLFVILILLTLFFSKNLQPRYYLSAYIIFGFLLCDLHKIYYKKMFYKCFINLIKFQAYSVLIILIISSLIFLVVELI